MLRSAIRITIPTCCLVLVTSCAGLRQVFDDAEQPPAPATTTPTAVEEPEPPPPRLPDPPPPEAAEAEPDTWVRMRSGFRLDVPEREAIDRELQWYLQHPRYLRTVLARAGRFLPGILAAIEDRGLPAELALLPVIESAYRPRARSPGDAMGLWQFIPATGRRYGLRQTPWTDDRGDVTAATAAALEHLQGLADSFEGDWLRALAAYNCGARKVRRAVAADLEGGGSGDFWSLQLPRITRRYVPKLLALSKLIAEATARAYPLPELAQHEELASVAVPRPLSLHVAAELAGMTAHELWDLNADLRRPVTPPGDYALRLPPGPAARLRSGLATLPDDEWMRWTEHVVQKGENLWLIARRYGTTVASLKQVNGLGSNLIRPGKALLLPPGARVAPPAAGGI